jgi:hypothetical protein
MIARQAQLVQTAANIPKKHITVKTIWPISSLWLLFMLSSSVRDQDKSMQKGRGSSFIGASWR